MSDALPTATTSSSAGFRGRGAVRWSPGARTIHVRHNRNGFRDHEYGLKVRPRLAFLGDSFVWGYDSEEEERFTSLLQAALPQWEVLNWGVSGYGTDQEYLLGQRAIPQYQPDVVVLVYSLNDSRDNRANLRYAPYYKPYFVLHAGVLRLRGVPSRSASPSASGSIPSRATAISVGR